MVEFDLDDKVKLPLALHLADKHLVESVRTLGKAVEGATKGNRRADYHLREVFKKHLDMIKDVQSAIVDAVSRHESFNYHSETLLKAQCDMTDNLTRLLSMLQSQTSLMETQSNAISGMQQVMIKRWGED